MAASLFSFKKCCWCSSEWMRSYPKILSSRKSDGLQSRSKTVPSEGKLYSRRHGILHGGASLLATLAIDMSLPVKAEEENPKGQGGDDGNADKDIISTMKSLFDPNEKTKTGKVLPKAYLKSAREVVQTLRESLEEDGKDIAKFRRIADAARESIREFLNGWRGQQAVVAEESYISLEKAIRSLAGFYSRAGPFASLPDDIKTGILDDLRRAEAFL